ncbi:MAG: D-sedoheptulose 7-phosphate isomerase [Rhodospirillales bacterium]
MSLVRDELVRHREVVDRVLDGLVGGIERAGTMVVDSLRAGGTLFIFGNGGSAADAQHIAAELVGRYLAKKRKALPAIALTTDTSALTAIANDFSFATVFERQVEALARPGDVALGISTSGESENVLLGLKAAQAAGAATIALLGRSGGRIASVCDLPLVVPSDETPRIQEMHILIGHLMCAHVDTAFTEG